MKTICLFIICLVWAYSPDLHAQSKLEVTHNITAVSVLFPEVDSTVEINLGVGPIIEFKNNGTFNEANVVLTVVVRNPQGTVVYRDTVVEANWISGKTRDLAFRPFTPTQPGIYYLCGIACLASDEVRSDDTICSTVHAVGVDPDNTADIKAVDIIDPALGAKKTEKDAFQPKAVFQFVSGKTDFHDVTAHLSIVRTSDGVSLFEIDSLIPLIPKDLTLVTFSFPNRWRDIAISDIGPDWYRMTVTVNLNTDKNHSNDTAISVFQVIPMESVSGGPSDVSGLILSQNRPNPFANESEIEFSLPAEGIVTLGVYDMTGRLVRTELSAERLGIGDHTVQIGSNALSNGLYTYELTFSGSKGEVKRLVKTMAVIK